MEREEGNAAIGIISIVGILVILFLFLRFVSC